MIPSGNGWEKLTPCQPIRCPSLIQTRVMLCAPEWISVVAREPQRTSGSQRVVSIAGIELGESLTLT